MPKHTQPQNRSNIPAGAMLSASPEKAMKQMIETIDTLRSVYIEENKALENVDTQAFMDIQGKKFEAATLYQKGIEEVLARKDEMRLVDTSLKRQLERMQADFSTLAHENKEALKRMQRTMNRLSDTIRSAAKDAVNKQQATSYGNSGRLNTTEKRVVTTGISETA